MTGRVDQPWLIWVGAKDWLVIGRHGSDAGPRTRRSQRRELWQDLAGRLLEPSDAGLSGGGVESDALHSRANERPSVRARNDVSGRPVNGPPNQRGGVRQHLAANRLDG